MRFSPDVWRSTCRTAPTASPTSRTTHGSPRLPSRSACTASRAIARPKTRAIKLDLPQSVDREDLQRIVEAVTLARDLINTPANDMGPAQLEQAARKLAARHSATIGAIVGDALLEKNFPLIHAVGRAAAGAPRLIDMTWSPDSRGDAAYPRVTLVGKGVCFDTGGLDIKPDTGMLNMKKDMGGAATALALAHMIMARGLKLRLRVLIPAVENSIAGSASGRATSTPRARGLRSRSAIPTPRAASSSPTRWRLPTRTSRT